MSIKKKKKKNSIRKDNFFCFSFNFNLQGLTFFICPISRGRTEIKIKKFWKPTKLYAIVYKIQWKLYKQLHITLQVFKIFQFLFRYLPLKLDKKMRPCKLKLNKKQKRLFFLIEFFSEWSFVHFCKIGNFLTKMFSAMLRTFFPVISVFRLKCVSEFY